MAARPAGDRYGSPARRVRSRSCPPRKPAGLRQDHRFVLSGGRADGRAEPRTAISWIRSSALVVAGLLGAIGALTEGAAPISPASDAPDRAAFCPSIASGSEICAPPFRKSPRRDRKNPRRRVGQSRPHRGRVRSSRRVLHRRFRAGRHRRHHLHARKPRSATTRWRRAAKRSSVFAAHLANWELPAVGRQDARHQRAPSSIGGRISLRSAT